MYLFQRDNGFWYVCFKRSKAKSLGTKDAREARRLFAAIKDEVRDRKISVLYPRPTSLGAFLDQYDRFCQDRHKPTTYKRERRIFQSFRNFMGDHTALHAITQRQGEKYISFLRDKGLSPVSINIELRTLKAAFSRAVEWNATGTDKGKYAENNPFRYIRALKYQREKPRYIEKPDAINKLFEVVSAEGRTATKRIYRLVVALYVYTGARRSEIHRLQWKDIGKDAITFRERKNYEMLKVPILPQLRAILDESGRGIGRIIPVTLDQMSRRLKYYLRQAGMGHLKPHDLRHTFASHLILSGVSIDEVQKLLGHLSPAATRIYTHLTEAAKEAAISKLPY